MRNLFPIICFCSFVLAVRMFRIGSGLTKEEFTNSNIKIVSSSKDETASLACENSKSIHILDASYGNPSLENMLIKKDPLDAPHTLPVVQMLCEGKNQCDIKVTNETFKILSLIKEFHKFLVKYICISEKIPTFPEYNIISKRGDDNTWNIEFSKDEKYKEDYLHINNLNGTCDDPIQTKNYIDVNEAIQECNNLSNCVFIILNTDGYILCQSSYYKNAMLEKGSKIYIKISRIAGRIPSNYEIYPNIQGVCEKEDILSEMENVMKLDDVYPKCDEIQCDYFTMSTAHGVKGASKTFRNHVWFCKGYPKYVSHDGFIFGKNNKGSKEPKQRITLKNFEGALG